MAYGYETIGSKYASVKGLDVKVIAKFIRADIKAAQKAGELPKVAKALVNIDRFSGGCSIHVTLKDIHPGIEFRSDEFRRLEIKLEEIVGAYKYTDSDAMSDYHHTNFFSHVRVEAVSPYTKEVV